jgi:DNA-binding transcriptional regulator YdaS (Cro superfamily)
MNQPTRTPVEAVEAAIKHFGNASRMAEALEVSDQTVSFWRKGERDGRPVYVPAHLCPRVERLTSLNVRCEELNPTVEWDVLRMQAGEWDGSERRAANSN